MSEESVTRLQEQMKNVIQRLNKVENMYDMMNEMNGNIKLLVHQMGDVSNIAHTNQNEINQIKEQPSNNYREIKIASVVAVITSIVGYVVGKM